MKQNISFFLIILAAIAVAGILLDEAAKGTFGGPVKSVAQKVTRGFGV